MPDRLRCGPQTDPAPRQTRPQPQNLGRPLLSRDSCTPCVVPELDWPSAEGRPRAHRSCHPQRPGDTTRGGSPWGPHGWECEPLHWPGHPLALQTPCRRAGLAGVGWPGRRLRASRPQAEGRLHGAEGLTLGRGHLGTPRAGRGRKDASSERQGEPGPSVPGHWASGSRLSDNGRLLCESPACGASVPQPEETVQLSCRK